MMKPRSDTQPSLALPLIAALLFWLGLAHTSFVLLLVSILLMGWYLFND